MFDKRRGSGNNFAKQEVMSWNVISFPACGKLCILENKMAEQQRSSSSSGSNIQQFIRTVLSLVTNLQGQSSSNNEPGSLPQQYSSVQDEISAQFHMPRGWAAQTDEPPSNLGALVDFNPPQNYSTPPIRRQVRSLRGMGNRHSRGGSHSTSHTATCTAPEPEYYYKDVCLLPSPDYDQVPRGSAKASLVENGLYVDAFKLDKTWSEARLCSELAALFEHVTKRPGQHAIP